MAAFFSELLDDFLNPDFLGKVHKKFHYGEGQLQALRGVAEEMLPLMRKEAFWERGASRTIGQNQGNADVLYEDVAISLGNRLDDLQEGYMKRGMLSESYMLETLAGELLVQSYSAYNRYAGMDGGWHVARYHFPGSEEGFPLEMLPEMLEALTGRVVCNAAFCMQPKKSVAFVAELTKDAKIRCAGICTGCNSAHCPNRIEGNSLMGRLTYERADMPLNYGYARIFGKQ